MCRLWTQYMCASYERALPRVGPDVGLYICVWCAGLQCVHMYVVNVISRVWPCFCDVVMVVVAVCMYLQ